MNTELNTTDKLIAMAVLERHLESADLINVRIKNHDGVYSIVVSEPKNVAGKLLGENYGLDSPIHVQPLDSVTSIE